MIEKYGQSILTSEKKPDKPQKVLESGRIDGGKRRKPSSIVEAVEIDVKAGADYPSLKDFYITKKPESYIEKQPCLHII